MKTKCKCACHTSKEPLVHDSVCCENMKGSLDWCAVQWLLQEQKEKIIIETQKDLLKDYKRDIKDAENEERKRIIKIIENKLTN